VSPSFISYGRPACRNWQIARNSLGGEFLTLLAGAMLFQQQVAEPLFEAVDDIQRRPLGQVGQEAKLRLGLEVVAVASHQRQSPAVFGSGRVDLSPAGCS